MAARREAAVVRDLASVSKRFGSMGNSLGRVDGSRVCFESDRWPLSGLWGIFAIGRTDDGRQTGWADINPSLSIHRS
jgi:hypothetical protein